MSEDKLERFSSDQIEYREVEPWAIAGLVLGLVSAVAMIAPILWLVPPLGMLASGTALRRIKSDPHRSGRAAALAGLGFSILFAVAPVAKMAGDYFLLRDQGRPLADQFIEYLREDRPQRAMTLRVAPDVRQNIEGFEDDELWAFFRGAAEAKKDLTTFVNTPIVRAILALGKRAEARFFRTASVGTDGAYARVIYWYTFTFPDQLDNNKKKTFLIGVVVERKPIDQAGIYPWRVKDLYGPLDATAL